MILKWFLPAKSIARLQNLEKLKHETGTVILYEVPHRIVKILKDCLLVLCAQGKEVLTRGPTKTFDTEQSA